MLLTDSVKACCFGENPPFLKRLLLTYKILVPLQLIRKFIAIKTTHNIYNLGMPATKVQVEEA